MTKTKIFTWLMLPVVVLLGYLLFDSINSKIVESENIKRSEKLVIERLNMIREAQKTYKSIKGVYAPNFDTLVDFVQNGQLHITEVKEKVTTRDRTDPDFYKGDIVTQEVDTIGVEDVLTKLFPKKDFPNFNPEDLRKVPGTQGKEFNMYTNTVPDKTGIPMAVIEVFDPYPMDKTRKADHPIKVRRFLGFGSRDNASLSGNWE